MKRRVLLTAAILLGAFGATAAPASAASATPSAGVMCISVLGTPICLSSLF